jgi:hypothetical protein
MNQKRMIIMMNLVPITLNLPENLVKQAEEAGLLNEANIEAWLITELDRQKKLDTFFDTLERLSSLEPRLTEAEINAEIEAYRQEKRQQGKMP